MNNIKQLMGKIQLVEKDIEKSFKRLYDLELMIVGAKVLNKETTYIEFEINFTKSNIENLKKQIEKLREYKIDGINGEIVK